MKSSVTCLASLMLLAAFVLALPIPVKMAQAAPSTSPVASQESSGNFSIIWITDTQYLSESHPAYFDSLCRWIVDNVGVYNVKMVVHTGDLVEDEWNQTQWENANRSMGILLDNGVPYCWDAGNHDYNATYWIGDEYSAFNPQVMNAQSYWLSDEGSGQNTAVHFSASGWDWLIVNLAYQANETALSWASNLLDARPESHAIVATHAYLNRTVGYESWATNFKGNVLDAHSSVFLTLSGHYYPTSGISKEVGGRHELMYNRQDKDSQIGAANARILTFDTAHGTIDVKTFYIYANTFLADSDNQFTLSTTFVNADAGKVDVPTEGGEAFPVVAVFVVTVIVVVCVLVLAAWRLKRKRSDSRA